MPDENMTPAVICLIFSSYFASVYARINPPDFDSGWLTIQATDLTTVSLARKDISHGLGVTPLLVDVQVKAIDGPNKDYVFQATGHQIRDDDREQRYGNVLYVYDSKSVIVSAPVRYNHNFAGKPIFIANATFWVGPNQDYSSNSALFRVRAWKESSLPPADFVSTSNVLTAATVQSSYLEVFHGFGELPALVISRIRFPSTLMEYPNFYADSVGAGIIVYITKGRVLLNAGYVVHGYDHNYIRVWAYSAPSGTLFDGTDGSGIYVAVSSASLELFAWTISSLTPDACNVLSSFTNEIPAAIFSLTRAWAGANDGANAGFIFPGSGSLAYSEQPVATPCSYGGLVYAYSNQSVRFWRPASSHGSIICIQDVFGNGTNSQASSDVQLFMFTWITDDNESSAGISPCNVNVFCTKTVGIFTCHCKSGYPGNGQTCTDCVPDISHGNVTLKNTLNTTDGAEATVSCDVGYNTTLPVVKCSANGTWDIPTCKIKECGNVPSVIHGNATLKLSQNTTYGAEATVVCDLGYNTTLPTIVCTENGIWQTSTCKIKAQPEGNKLVVFIAVPVSIVVLLVFVLTVIVLLLRRKPKQNEDDQQLTDPNTANATNDDNIYDVIDSFGDSYYNYDAVYRTDDNDQNYYTTGHANDYDFIDSFGDSYYNYHAIRTDDNDHYTTGHAGGGDPFFSNIDRNDTDSAIHNIDSS